MEVMIVMIVSAVSVLLMLFLLGCLRMPHLIGGEGTRQSKGIGRQPDGPDEEELKLYFRYRDEGHPADPTLVIPHEWHYINRVKPLGFWRAEEEYQEELMRREQDRQHQAHLDWLESKSRS